MTWAALLYLAIGAADLLGIAGLARGRIGPVKAVLVIVGWPVLMAGAAWAEGRRGR